MYIFIYLDISYCVQLADTDPCCTEIHFCVPPNFSKGNLTFDVTFDRTLPRTVYDLYKIIIITSCLPKCQPPKVFLDRRSCARWGPRGWWSGAWWRGPWSTWSRGWRTGSTSSQPWVRAGMGQDLRYGSDQTLKLKLKVYQSVPDMEHVLHCVLAK